MEMKTYFKITIITMFSLLGFIGCSSSNNHLKNTHADQFQNSFKSHIPTLQKCYSNQSPKEKTIESKIYLQFTVNYLGIAENISASAKTFTLNQTVEKCIIEEVKKIKFPLPQHDGGSYNIYQPINFLN